MNITLRCTMKWLIALMLLLAMTVPVMAAEANFIETWKQFEVYGDSAETGRSDFSSIVIHFNRQARQERHAIAGETRKAYLVYNLAFIDNAWIIFYLPYASERFYEEDLGCRQNHSYLAYKGVFSAIPINPLCSESDSIDDLDVTFYFSGNRPLPYLAVTTNGPACVPSWLYRLDAKAHRFDLLAEACGG